MWCSPEFSTLWAAVFYPIRITGWIVVACVTFILLDSARMGTAFSKKIDFVLRYLDDPAESGDFVSDTHEIDPNMIPGLCPEESVWT
jgi:hypothetical protein